MTDRSVEVRLRADISQFQRSMMTAGASAQSLASRLEAADGRMAALVQTGLALAPALVPLGAAAVPAIAGLTLQLGLAAAAGATTLLAFQGVGDGLSALNAFQLKPTEENFAKLQAAMDKLGPAGQEFVLHLDKMEPELKRLRSMAEAGLLPGVGDSLDELIKLAPQAEQALFNIGDTVGGLIRDGADNLNDPRWVAFFDYLDRTARPVLTEMGHTFGNVIEGIANSIMAFDPLARDFSAGLLDWSEGFKQATENLDTNEGFQRFVDYVQAQGPKALETLGAIGRTLVDLVTAAAPVGSASLTGLKVIAETLSAIAESPVGPVLISAAAAVGVLGRSLALLKAVGLRGGETGLIGRTLGVDKAKGVVASIREVRAATDELTLAEERRAKVAVATRDAQFALLPTSGKQGAVREYVAAQREAAAAAEKVQAAERGRAAAIRETAAAAGKGVAAAAGLAVATTGLADGMGLSNTASLALMGTLAGPWGAAVGGSIGAVMDFAKANNDVEDAVRASGRALAGSSIDFSTQAASLAHARAAYDDYASSVQKGNAKVNPFDPSTYKNLSGPGDAFKALSDKFTHSSSEMHDAIRKQVADFQSLRDGAKNVYETLSGKSFTGSAQDLTSFVTKISPALQRAKIDVNDFLDAMSGKTLNPALMLKGVRAISDYFASFDSATGKSKAVAAALQELGNQMETDASQAEGLKSAMDSLFGVELTQSAATDAWTKQLRELAHTIAGTNGAIRGTSAAALTNRDAIRSSVQSLEDKVNADAAAGVSGDRLVNSLIKGRNAIIQQATAAGASRKQVAAYLNTLGLTPKNLTTIIRADGALSAKQKVEALARVYGLTPRQLRTFISEQGSGATRAKLTALLRQYGLTPKQINTILRAQDKASAEARKAKRSIDQVKDKSVAIRAKENASAMSARARSSLASVHDRNVAIRVAQNAAAAAAAARNAMFSVHDRTVTLTVRTQHISTYQAVTIPGITKPRGVQEAGGMWHNGVQTFADGGFGSDGRYYARAPQMVAGGTNILWGEKATGWEAYISGKPAERDRNLDIWRMAGDRLGARFEEYAMGGIKHAQITTGGGGHVRVDMTPLRQEIRSLRREIAGIRAAVREGSRDGAREGTAHGIEGAARGSTARGRLYR